MPTILGLNTSIMKKIKLINTQKQVEFKFEV